MNTAVLDFETRGRFEGMINILRFNWPLYLRALTVVLGMGFLIILPTIPVVLKLVCACTAVVSIFYLGISLLVSHWIYDYSSLYSLSWLTRAVAFQPNRIINLTAGFDETTLRLRSKYPGAIVGVRDFYDPTVHTEPSIARARAYRPPLPETIQITSQCLGLEPKSTDLVLGILALHEIREPQERAKLFQSISEVLQPHGRCIVVEHLRDLPNFLAFGPGFFHFFSRHSWLEAAQSEALRLVDEFSITPFIHVFVLEKTHA